MRASKAVFPKFGDIYRNTFSSVDIECFSQNREKITGRDNFSVALLKHQLEQRSATFSCKFAKILCIKLESILRVKMICVSMNFIAIFFAFYQNHLENDLDTIVSKSEADFT